MLTLDNGVLTIQNLSNGTIKVAFKNTIEDSATIKGNESLILHENTDAKFVGAKVVNKGCDCWLQLVTDCDLLPLSISGINFKRINETQIEVSFWAYQTGEDRQHSFITQYSLDKGQTWKSVTLDIPTVTGISQHFTKIININ